MLTTHSDWKRSASAEGERESGESICRRGKFQGSLNIKLFVCGVHGVVCVCYDVRGVTSAKTSSSFTKIICIVKFHTNDTLSLICTVMILSGVVSSLCK